MQFFVKARKLWDKWSAPIGLIGIPAALIVWAYSNFATAKEVEDTKAEIQSYVDVRHSDVKEELHDIKEMLREQRELQSRILLRLSR